MKAKNRRDTVSGGAEAKTIETQIASDLPIYPIRTVARLSGVDARRIRAWESQYGLLRPARTRGGHRLFSQQDIDRIRRIRQLIDEEGLRLQGVRLLLEAESAANGDQ
jgi:DNA-binding transcriptional MerR regulator